MFKFLSGCGKVKQERKMSFLMIEHFFAAIGAVWVTVRMLIPITHIMIYWIIYTGFILYSTQWRKVPLRGYMRIPKYVFLDCFMESLSGCGSVEQITIDGVRWEPLFRFSRVRSKR